MKVEVDQSTKLEQSGPTIVAYANGKSGAIIVPSTVKHAAFKMLSSKGKSKDVSKWLLFAACIFLLLQDQLPKLKRVLIDVEYTGKSSDIKASLLRYIWRVHSTFDESIIQFGYVGKGSPADVKARNVRLGHDCDYRKVKLKDLVEVMV
jgi:hypothetical protein